MERKQVTVKWFVPARHIVLILLTLSFFGCTSRQVTEYPFDNQDYMQRFTQVIYQLGKAIERERCLSAVILTARDTNKCFDCHDKIER